MLEGSSGWETSVLCWLQSLQGATRGIKGPVSFLGELLMTRRRKSDSILKTCCAPAVVWKWIQLKRAIQNTTVNLPHLIQCTSQDAVAWLFAVFPTVIPHCSLLWQSTFIQGSYCFNLNITKTNQKTGLKPQSNSTHNFRSEINLTHLEILHTSPFLCKGDQKMLIAWVVLCTWIFHLILLPVVRMRKFASSCTAQELLLGQGNPC